MKFIYYIKIGFITSFNVYFPFFMARRLSFQGILYHFFIFHIFYSGTIVWILDFLYFVSHIYHLLYNRLLSFTFLFVLHDFLQHIRLYPGLSACVYVCMFVCLWYLGKIVMGRVYLKYCLAIKEGILNSYSKDTSFLSWDILQKEKNWQIFYIMTFSMLQIICLSPSSPLPFLLAERLGQKQ